MKHTIIICCLVICCGLLTACKKSNNTRPECYNDNNVLRELNNQPATVQQSSGGEYYIAEPNIIDTRLFPCNLPAGFQQKNLAILITGQVKSLPATGLYTAGDQAIIITGITRQ
jgi:hypothetical protein